jgi:hypothetical protein
MGHLLSYSAVVVSGVTPPPFNTLMACTGAVLAFLGKKSVRNCLSIFWMCFSEFAWKRHHINVTDNMGTINHNVINSVK